MNIKKEKAIDERLDFWKIYDFVEKFDDYPSNIHCFMDAKGLYFYLPAFLLIGYRDDKETVLRDLVIGKDPKYIELMNLLTVEQKKAIIECIERNVDYDD